MGTIIYRKERKKYVAKLEGRRCHYPKLTEAEE
jgi:hypothetical protein